MARQLDSYSFKRPGKYDWDGWFTGDVWELVQGEDFTCRPAGLIAAARTAAKKAGLKLNVALVEPQPLVKPDDTVTDVTGPAKVVLQALVTKKAPTVRGRDDLL